MDEKQNNVATDPSHEEDELAVKELQQSGFDEVLNFFEPKELKPLKENER